MMRAERRPDEAIAFRAFGVSIGIRSADRSLLTDAYQAVAKRFPDGAMESIPFHRAEFKYGLRILTNGDFVMYLGGRRVTGGPNRFALLKYFQSMVRLRIAEFAENVVFVHAGVVEYNGRAIVLPAHSHSGKTALVAELVRHGARYMSDEYAIVDTDGRVIPFPKRLSVRPPEGGEQIDTEISDIGGRVYAGPPVEAGLVILTRYERTAEWSPVRLSAGMGVLKILPHAIPASRRPEFTLNVLNKMTSRAIILESLRGEAPRLVPYLLKNA